MVGFNDRPSNKTMYLSYSGEIIEKASFLWHTNALHSESYLIIMACVQGALKDMSQSARSVVEFSSFEAIKYRFLMQCN